jgi:predicted homoserine dehydrogenase-like protein
MNTLEKALSQREAEGRPIHIGLIGAGFMGRGVALQLGTPLVGMRLVAISNRHVAAAQQAWAAAGAPDIVVASKQVDVDKAIAQGKPVVTADADLLCHATGIDVLIEATADVEFAAHVVLEAITARKHIVLMNATVDATLGPILKVRADEAGVVISNADGDEPGIAVNLLRYVQAIGFRPVMAGNLKGFLDRYRTSETQREFAEKTGQRAKMCAAYADGTKLNLEACLVANATGFKVGRRGMYGPRCEHVNDIVEQMAQNKIDSQQLLQQPLVDYVLGAQPGAGVFVVGYNDDPAKRKYMDYLKMGSGPLYVFYSPYVFPHLESPFTAARVVLEGEATIAPRGAPVCNVITLAKRDLKAGEILDGLGGFATYGLIENAEIVRTDKLLPIGLSEGCRVLRDIRRDGAISYSDIELPTGRLCDRLRAEQDRHFHSEIPIPTVSVRRDPATSSSAIHHPQESIH